MSVVKVQGNASGTGIFTIAAPNSNNTRTMTLSDSDGTIYIAPGDGIQALAGGIPAARTITAGTGISVANGTGVGGNPTITNSGVTDFNTRTGSVTLASSDVTTALGYTPAKEPATNGLVTRTAAGSYSGRTITASTGISVSNGDGVAGNPTITNSGVTSVAAGTGISVSAGTGGVTITNSGVTSVTAGSNISVSASTGGVTISSTAGAPTTAQVLSATAGASVGAVGSYSLMWNASGSNLSPGNTISGSSLYYASAANGHGGAINFGTWRCMGYAYNSCSGSAAVTVFLRIS